VHAHQEQSRSVGGDLYDVKLLESGRLLILVADVSGKGMGAALLMSNILASFRTLYDGKEFGMCDAVQRVSRQILKFSDAEDFATLFIAELDDSGTLRYINAGHNPPLHVHADGTLEHLKPSGIMIGAFDFTDWEEHQLVLNPDDTLFIFSDGVTEAERDGVQYGDALTEEKVVQWHDLSPRELLSNMMEDINTFMGDAPRSDDITMLAVKRTTT
jgi:sigma-B regulation protein RsbU (phosphoserine phosphatase)